MKCGFIGLGSQGAPMARRMLDAGFDVTLWARRPDSLAPFADTKAKTAASVAELYREAERQAVPRTEFISRHFPNYSAETIRNWVRIARERGKLAPARPRAANLTTKRKGVRR